MSEKIVYQYDLESGKLLRTTSIQESPLEPGVWLWPPDVTELAPPPPVEGLDTIFDETAQQWSQVLIPMPPLPITPTQDPREAMVVSRFQALAALLQAGLLDETQAYFAGTTVSQMDKLAWDNALHFYRLSPLVISVGTALGMSDIQLDELFANAKSIEA